MCLSEVCKYWFHCTVPYRFPYVFSSILNSKLTKLNRYLMFSIKMWGGWPHLELLKQWWAKQEESKHQAVWCRNNRGEYTGDHKKYFCTTTFPLRHYWSRNHGAIVTSMKQKFFFTVCGHELIFKGFLPPSVAPFKYLFFSTWVPFLLSFTIINTILFFIFTRLQLFNYLSPRELFPPAQYGASTFSTFRKNFFQR